MDIDVNLNLCYNSDEKLYEASIMLGNGSTFDACGKTARECANELAELVIPLLFDLK